MNTTDVVLDTDRIKMWAWFLTVSTLNMEEIRVFEYNNRKFLAFSPRLTYRIYKLDPFIFFLLFCTATWKIFPTQQWLILPFILFYVIGHLIPQIFTFNGNIIIKDHRW